MKKNNFNKTLFLVTSDDPLVHTHPQLTNTDLIKQFQPLSEQ